MGKLPKLEENKDIVSKVNQAEDIEEKIEMIGSFPADEVQEEKKNNKHQTKEVAYVFSRVVDLDPDQGLSTEEAEKRIEHHYNNTNDIKTTKTGWQIIAGNVFTFFNMLYVVIAVLLILAKSFNNLTFVVVIAFNLSLGIIQEFKAKKQIEQLNLISSVKTTVIRDGEKQEIDTSNVVMDDIVKYSTGNQIIADSIVRRGFIEVNESNITGESDSISKKEGDFLYSGSYVVSGTCLAQVEHVGKDNYIEKLAIEAKKQKGNKSELLRTLNWIIKIIGIIIIPIALISFYQAYQNNLVINPELSFYENFSQCIKSVSGSVIGMIPSGLYLLTSTALFLGVYRLAKKNRTNVQQLYCIEMLARVDVLCLDKTGTITDGTMRVIDCVEIKNPTDYTMREIIGSMMNSFEETNATSEALIRFFDVNKVLTPIKILPFSSQRKYSAVYFDHVGTFFLGAPEFVLIDGLEKVKSKVDRYASQGCRVLALGYTPTQSANGTLPKNVKPVGLIVIQDHIRDEAYETIEFFRNNGVEIKVISGDNPQTVSEIASRAGVSNANRYVSLEGLTEDEVKEIAFDYTIFGRVTPPQKKALVEAYKEKKKTVAMTGDGVNDILALKEADCSIAMASGSEATRNVANIVLMDSNFSAMPSVVAEGRRVINNIQRTSTLFLVKTIFTILLTIYCMCLNKEYLFEPSQLIIIEFFLIGLPATFISIQPNKEKVQGRFISNVLKTSFPGALTVLIFNIIIDILAKRCDFGWIDASGQRTELFTTVSLLVTTSICVFVLYRMCKPFNIFKSLVFIFVLIFSIVIFYLGLINSDARILSTTVGKLINGFLKLDFPSDDLFSRYKTINELILIILILFINPAMNFIETLLGKAKKIKLS